MWDKLSSDIQITWVCGGPGVYPLMSKFPEIAHLGIICIDETSEADQVRTQGFLKFINYITSTLVKIGDKLVNDTSQSKKSFFSLF